MSSTYFAAYCKKETVENGRRKVCTSAVRIKSACCSLLGFKMTIVVYITSVTFKKELHTQQNHIETVLKAKQLPYQLIDIAQDPSKKEEMREKIGNETAIAPQIFNEDYYCGDYKAFQQAVEEEDVLTFLKVV